MSVLSVLGMLAWCAAAVSLWLGARGHDGVVVRAYRWLAGAAALYCLGLISQQFIGGALNPAPGLSFADLPPLLALAVAAVGIGILTTAEREGDSSAQRLLSARSAGSAGPDGSDSAAGAGAGAGSGSGAGSGAGVSVLPGLADGYVMAVALLVIGWVTLFSAEFHRSGERPGTFLLALVHPLADLAVLGALLPMVTTAWRRVTLPYLSLLAVAVGDALAVGQRVAGGHLGVAAQLMPVVAALLLGVAPWRVTEGGWTRRTASSAAATVIAALAASVATVVVVVSGLAGAPVSGAALVVAGGAGVLVLAGRVFMLVRDNGVILGLWRESSRSLRDLANRTSDVVLVCDLEGTIRYSSQAIQDYGYAPGALVGRRLLDFVHPADRGAALAAVRLALGGYHPAGSAESPKSPGARSAEGSGRFPARVRAADGTWRHIESTVLRYQAPGEPIQMLVTARDVSDQVALRQQVTHLTFHDGLTGLPNRAYVEERARDVLAAAALAGERLARERLATAVSAADGLAADGLATAVSATDGLATAVSATDGLATAVSAADGLAADGLAHGAATGRPGVIFLDLDRFTAVNDSVGHGAGDLVLTQAARRLRAVVPVHDTVSRWGSDEFAVLIEHAGSVQEVTEIAERMVGAVAAEPFRVVGQQIALTASAGVALAEVAQPDSGDLDNQPGLVLRNADVAMSRAKDTGGDRVEVYAAHMHADAVRKLEIVSELQGAISNGEFRLQYQPIVDLATSRVTGAEALVRWRRGDKGNGDGEGRWVRPREFLGAAEESGLIVPLGEWVLREACAQGAAWRRSSWDVGVSVNLSAREITTPMFTTGVAAILADTGLPPEALTVEVNERILVEEDGLIIDRLADLHRLGVRIAIDDFGTGYASLAHLRQLPLDIIKIDPSFVAGLGHDDTLTLLTRTVVQVGRDLGLRVIAEGIEQPRQLIALREMGCGYGQGFLVAKPMAAPEVEALIRTAAGESDERIVSECETTRVSG
jgi:diguanylate cyclase (GGDEF)-like protein